MPVDDARRTRRRRPPIDVDGVTYTIKSEAKWITDDVGGTPACGTRAASRSSTCRSRRPSRRRSSARGSRRSPIDSLVAPTHRVRRGPRHARRQGRRPHRHQGVAGIAVTATSTGFTPPTHGDRRRRLRDLQVGPGRQLHDHAQHAGLRRPRRRNQLSRRRPDGRRQDGQLRHDALRPRDHARSTVNDAHPGHDLRRPPARSVEGARRLADQRRRASACCARSRRRARRTPSHVDRSCSRSRRTRYSFFTGALRRTPSPTRTSGTRTTSRATNPAAALLADPTQVQPQRGDGAPAAVEHPRHAPLRRPATFNDGDVMVYAQLQKPAVDRALRRAESTADDARPGRPRLGHRAAARGTGNDATGSRRPARVRSRACRSATTRSACVDTAPTAAQVARGTYDNTTPRRLRDDGVQRRSTSTRRTGTGARPATSL